VVLLALARANWKKAAPPQTLWTTKAENDQTSGPQHTSALTRLANHPGQEQRDAANKTTPYPITQIRGALI